MYASKRVAVRDLNPHILCALCGGYLIQATTVIECLHSFCRTCIVNFLETSKVCPICDAQIHKTRPLLNIRPDQTLQSLVYKLVPGLFQDEMRRRREFHATLPKSELEDLTLEERGEASLEREYKHGDDHVSLALQMVVRTSKDGGYQIHDTRYLLCPSELTVRHLKKFIRSKFQLNDTHVINLFRAKEELTDELMLQDIALIYSWRRDLPMIIVYTVREVKASVRGKPQTMKGKVASKQTDSLHEGRRSSDIQITEPSSIARAQKSSMQESSTEIPTKNLPGTAIEVTPPAPSPPLKSPASPSLSSPPLFSPPFFSTPTILPVPLTSEQIQSPASLNAKHTSFSAAPSHASEQASNSNTFQYLSLQDSQTNKVSRSISGLSKATDEDSSTTPLSKYCKFSSPSPPILELGPSVEQIFSAINTSLVSTAKEENEGSMLGPPLLHQQTASSSASDSSHCSEYKSAHSSKNLSSNCSFQTTPFKGPTRNVNVTISQNSSHCSLPVNTTVQYPVNSTLTNPKPPFSPGVGVDPNKLMHSVHAILNKSTSKRQVHTRPQPSIALHWTPVVEHKSPSVSTIFQKPSWLPDTLSSNNTPSSKDTKQSQQNQEVRSSSPSFCALKAVDVAHGKYDIKSFASPKKGVSGGDLVKPAICKESAREIKHFYKTDFKDFSGPSDIKSVQSNANQYSVDKKMNGGVKKVEVFSFSSESQNANLKSSEVAYFLKEDKYCVKKAAEGESEKHLKSSFFNKNSKSEVSNFLHDACLKTSEVLVKTEIDQPPQIKKNNRESKDERQDVQRQSEKSSQLTPCTTICTMTSLSGLSSGQDTCAPLHSKLKRLHSHPGQPTQPEKFGNQTSQLPVKSSDDETVSTYIPKYQKHKALYLSKRSMSCIEETAVAKTVSDTEQNMEKRNWKKRKLSTLDFDPASSGFFQKRDNRDEDVSSQRVVDKNGGSVGWVSRGSSSGSMPRCNSVNSDAADKSQVKHQFKADLSVSPLSADRLAPLTENTHLPSEQSGKHTVMPGNAYPTVSCLPITGSILVDTKSLRVSSREMPTGLLPLSSSRVGTDSGSASVRDQLSKGTKQTYLSNKASKNSDSGDSYISDLKSMNLIPNNNNNNNYYSTKDESISVSKSSNNIMTTSSAVHSNHMKQGSINTVSGVISQLTSKFTFASSARSGAKLGEPVHEKSVALPPREKTSTPGAERTSCISVVVTSHSRGSPSDLGSSSSSSTSPAADVTSPGTEDRANNSVILEMQVAPSCGKTYLSPHCTGNKGFPLDLSSRKRK